jgi:hypothetical protein
MKKLLLSITALATVALTTVNGASAQVIKGFYKQSYKSRNNGTFDKGTGLLSLGLGVPDHVHHFDPKSPAFYLKYEAGVADEIGVGVVGSIAFGEHIRGRENAINSLVGVLGYYHFNKIIPVQKLDVYAGAGFGINILNAYNPSHDTHVRPVFLGRVGVRYYFTNSFGVYAETGWDSVSSANLGVSFRF